ncbi:MAG: acyl-CoA dehydrogenase family protein [Proteobacteria bacterium]|nr:acyl-CoA dehydrogenase family protein [Pseudomonadota bacterium]
MELKIFNEEHEIYRRTVRQFMEKEVKPHVDEWREKELLPREIWRKMGEQGFLGAYFPEEFGGFSADFLTDVVFLEELARSQSTGLIGDVMVSNDVVAPYILEFAPEELKREYLPRLARGECIASVGITEPGTGSDVAAIRTTAEKRGNEYVINGQKTFVTGGFYADVVVLAVKTNPEAKPAHSGISLILVPKGVPGFSVGRKLKKMGAHDSATAELFFEDCRVPAGNLLGTEGGGFVLIMQKFQRERLVTVATVLPACEMILEQTINYCKERHVFGKPVASFQVNKHKLVEMATELELARTFCYQLYQEFNNGNQGLVKEISMAKYWVSELANRMAYQCVQLFGGYGYMDEYPISRAYTDLRAFPIVAGTTEIMKEIIAKTMGL